MAKTIKQIADEIGVSKQTVYKRYKGKLYTVCAPYAHTEQGVLYLSEQAETLIKTRLFERWLPQWIAYGYAYGALHWSGAGAVARGWCGSNFTGHH